MTAERQRSVVRENFTAGNHRVSALVSTTDPDPEKPLLVGLHGGGYNAMYFDAPGKSLRESALRNGFATLLVDRPSHGESTELSRYSFSRSAEVLDRAIATIWDEHGAGRPGIVVIGHSVGAAIAVHLASRHPSWPLLGISLSGIGDEQPPVDGDIQGGQTLQGYVDLPVEIRRVAFYGPPDSVGEDFDSIVHVGTHAVVSEEVVEIYGGWVDDFHTLAGQVEVPVQVVLGEHEAMWIATEESFARVAEAFTSAPFVDAAFYGDTGHNIDHHRVGEAWRLQQLAFAVRCAVHGMTVPG